jgi:dihydrofolate synthase/folylpolyglutamate synthase
VTTLEIETPVTRRLAAFGGEFGHGQILTLARIEQALAALGQPHRTDAKILHVAGTNGKGSTCAFLDSIARAAGLKVGLFTSPHLVRVNERIRINGAPVGDDLFVSALDQIGKTGAPLTYFEAINVAGFLLFRDAEVDVMVVEVGLGGRFDSTNVVTPTVSVITPIDLDHQAFLGDTIAAIAGEKAGIIKPRRPVVSARQKDPATEVIAEVASRLDAPLALCGRDFDGWAQHGRLAVQTPSRLFDLPAPSLVGAHQFDNAAVAVAAIDALGDHRIDEAAIGAGVAQAFWPGRMTRVGASFGDIWIDGAHNPHGAQALSRTLKDLNARAPATTILICGLFTNKDLDGIMAALAPAANQLIAIPVTGARASAAPEKIAACAAGLGLPASTAPTLQDALAMAQSNAPSARIVICGSLHLAGEALHHFGLM